MKKKIIIAVFIALLLVTVIFFCFSALFIDWPTSKPLSTKKDFPEPAANYDLLIENINIIDTETGDIYPNMNVLCSLGRIISISSEAIDTENTDTVIIDGTDKYLTPGFLNMHMHVPNEPNAHEISHNLLNYGITGYRQMSGSYDMLVEWNSGEYSTSTNEAAMLTLPIDIMTPMNAPTPELAQNFVINQKNEGALFIKSGGVTSDVFYSALDTANEAGLNVEGHILPDVDLRTASDNGLHCVDHFGINHGALISCSTKEDELRAESTSLPANLFENPIFVTLMKSESIQKFTNDILINWATSNSGGSTDINQLLTYIDTYSEEKAISLADTFVKNNTWQCPTMIRTKYGIYDECDKETADKVYDLYYRLVKTYEKEGVMMLGGTDGCSPDSLHEEFDELEKAGISPLTILQMVTINGARFLEMEDSLGSVSEGKVADLVLLNSNPLESAQGLHDIYGVVRAGEYHSIK